MAFLLLHDPPLRRRTWFATLSGLGVADNPATGPGACREPGRLLDRQVKRLRAARDPNGELGRTMRRRGPSDAISAGIRRVAPKSRSQPTVRGHSRPSHRGPAPAF